MDGLNAYVQPNFLRFEQVDVADCTYNKHNYIAANLTSF